MSTSFILASRVTSNDVDMIPSDTKAILTHGGLGFAEETICDSEPLLKLPLSRFVYSFLYNDNLSSPLFNANEYISLMFPLFPANFLIVSKDADVVGSEWSSQTFAVSPSLSVFAS